mgnify:CR=1 FL=1
MDETSVGFWDEVFALVLCSPWSGLCSCLGLGVGVCRFRDIDSDGDHDKSDKYLLNRRKVRGAAIKTRKEEVEEIVGFLKAQGEPEYVSGVVEGPDNETEIRLDQTLGLSSTDSDSDNALYDQAVAIVAQDRKCSTSYIQRKLSIGYNRAAKIVETMEEQGIVSQSNHVGKREVLIPEV